MSNTDEAAALYEDCPACLNDALTPVDTSCYRCDRPIKNDLKVTNDLEVDYLVFVLKWLGNDEEVEFS